MPFTMLSIYKLSNVSLELEFCLEHSYALVTTIFDYISTAIVILLSFECNFTAI